MNATVSANSTVPVNNSTIPTPAKTAVPVTQPPQNATAATSKNITLPSNTTSPVPATVNTTATPPNITVPTQNVTSSSNKT